MKRLGISKQILIIAIFPALLVSTILTTHYIMDQFDYISKSLQKNGNLIVRQLALAAEYAVYSGNTELIKPLMETVVKSNPVLRIQILDMYDDSVLDITSPEKTSEEESSIFERLFEDKKH